jgi:hypothetical protein
MGGDDGIMTPKCSDAKGVCLTRGLLNNDK